MDKKTLVLGASSHDTRYSNMAVKMLTENNVPVLPVGRIVGQEVAGWTIQKDWDAALKDIHTISMYLSAINQEQYVEKILETMPERIIFNPGAENENLALRADEAGIEVLEACTLVMLRTGQF